MKSSLDNNSTAPAAYIYRLNGGVSQSSLSSGIQLLGIVSDTESHPNTYYVSFLDFDIVSTRQTSSESLQLRDQFYSQRRKLYSLLSEAPYEDDTIPLSFFEEFRLSTEESLAFGQIMKVFLGAYKNDDIPVIIKVLRFMQNFSYQEIGQVGLSAAQLALLDSDNVDIQSSAISLVLLWKSKDFIDIMKKYKAPNDVFIKTKLKKLPSWYTLDQ